MPGAAVDRPASRPSGERAAPRAAAAATFTIGELAREFGLTTRAIRFYEDCGLLAPERSGRNRVYTARDRARLTLTLRGKRLGLKLAEVKALVDMYESRRDTQAQLRRYLDVLARHRAQLEVRLAELRTTLDEVLAQEAAARRGLRRRAKA
jgi:DNA-binding transcriptional MerR regulator